MDLITRPWLQEEMHLSFGKQQHHCLTQQTDDHDQSDQNSLQKEYPESLVGNENQYGYVAAVEYEIALTEEVTFTPIAEVAYLDNAGGIDNADTTFVTAGTSLGYGNWSASAVYQNRRTDDGTNTVTDHVMDFGVGYAFDIGLEVSAGYRIAEEDNVDNQGLGLLVGYIIEF